MLAGVHIGSLLGMVFTVGYLVARMIHVALATFFIGIGASRFMLS